MQIKMDVKLNASVWDVHQPQADKNRPNTSIIFLFEAAGPWWGAGEGRCKHSQRTEGQRDENSKSCILGFQVGAPVTAMLE